jgi:hypothetical protein
MPMFQGSAWAAWLPSTWVSTRVLPFLVLSDRDALPTPRYPTAEIQCNTVVLIAALW